VFWKKKSIILLLSAFIFFVSLFPLSKTTNAASYEFYDLSTWRVVGYNYATTGGFVGAVQSILAASNLSNYTHTDVDRSFGPKTFNTVKQFQSKHGLVADGNWGPATWRKAEALTYNVDSRTRRFRGGSANYEVSFSFYSDGASTTTYVYYLDKYNTPGSTYRSGSIWSVGPSLASVTSEKSTEIAKSTEQIEKNVNYQENNNSINKLPIDLVKDEVHIPLNLNEKTDFLKEKPDIVVAEEREGGHAFITWYNTNESQIMTSQSVNHYKDVVLMFDEIKNLWYKNSKTKELKIKGLNAIIEITEHGHDSLHIVTKDHIYTIAGEKENKLLKIANQIVFK